MTTNSLPPEYACPDCGFRTNDTSCSLDCPRCGAGSMTPTADVDGCPECRAEILEDGFGEIYCAADPDHWRSHAA